MILKLIFMQTSYIIFSISSIESYVLFAANADDFRNIAKKIIPSQLADKLADMATETATHHEYENSEETEQIQDDESRRKSPYPQLTQYKKRFDIEQQYGNINLDELVKRVKEQLEREYRTSTVGSVATTERVKRIDDYYYKDENLNVQEREVENEQVQRIPSDAFTTQKQKYAGYYEENAPTEYVDDNVKVAESNQDNTEESKDIAEYDSENANNGIVKEVIEYDNEDVKEESDHEDQKQKVLQYTKYDTGHEEVTDYEKLNVKNAAEHRQQKQKVVKVTNYDKEETDYENGNVKMAPVYNDKEVKYDYENDKEATAYQNGNVKYTAAHKNKDVNEKLDNNRNVQKAYAPKGYPKKHQYKETNQGVREYEENAKNTPEYYDDNVKDTKETPPADTIDIFKEIDMQKSNDSYEDYVTPAREIASDDDESTWKPKTNIHKFAATDNSKYNQKRPNAVSDVVINQDNLNTNEDANTPASPLPWETPQKQLYEIKAKTESLWYKDPDLQNYDDSTETTAAVAEGDPASKRKGLKTMFPTRAHFKMSSPNYLAEVPVVAEKYNFNEPIPERDRERENIKYIGNPPAFINKKVRI